MTQSKSHLRLRALCEGAIFIALAQVLSYLKLFELPQGGSITIEMLPIFLYCARWGFGPGMLASFAYSILQAVLSSTYAWTWQSLIVGALLWKPLKKYITGEDLRGAASAKNEG